MNRTLVLSMTAILLPGAVAVAQNAPATDHKAAAVTTASELADSLAHRLSQELHLKTVVGEPLKVGSLTLIPILMVDLGFGGGSLLAPSPAAPSPAPSSAPPTPSAKPTLGDAFFMSGEARPLGFVAVTSKGARFVGVTKAPAR
jgi:uncharacterized spore protein YtfJ